MATAIDGFFRRLVDSALNPLFGLLSDTLLMTPDPLSLPRVAQLWHSSWQLMLAGYGLLVMAAGILLMVYETLQTRWDWQQLVPRLVAGFVAGAMSMLIATQAVRFANALAAALAGDGVDPGSATAALHQVVTDSSSVSSSIFVSMLLTALVVMVTVLLVTYAVRVSITIMLIVAAPLMLMCHGLPATEPIARWWWRAFGTCLAIQVVQSLALVTVLRVFLTPGGWGPLGPNEHGAVNLIVALALFGMLVKVPFWLLSGLRIGGGRSLPATIVRSYVMFKAMRLLKGTSTKPTTGRLSTSTRLASPGTKRTNAAAVSQAADPYTRARTGRDGQMLLPLDGVRRVPRHHHASTTPSGTSSTVAVAAREHSRGRQLALDFREPDPYQGIRPLRGGQLPLPIPVRRVPATPTLAPAAAPPRAHRGAAGSAGKQLAFEFDPDPYRGDRPLRGGQYPLPLELRRSPRPTPPPPVAAPPTPPRTGRQLPLPDMPTCRRTPRRGGTRRK